MILRPYQQRAIAELRAAYAAGRRAPCLVLPTGAGKCLGLGTPVLRFDGAVVPVEDVRVGDLLMGPDSQPRRVLSTCRGHSSLYRIVPARGTPWVCNDVHVLTLVHTETGAIVDIDLPTYLAESKWFRHLYKQFAPGGGIDFAPAEPLPLDPYFLGVWYGDGTKRLAGVDISKPDHEIFAACEDVAAQFGLRIRTDYGSTGCPTHHIVGPRTGGGPNPLLDLLRTIYGNGASFPRQYLTASRRDRLEFLAGVLDTDGYMHRSGFEIVQKQRGFADGVAFLARSLGMRAIIAEKVVNGDSYWRVTISGDCSVIPTRIPRKQAPPRRQIKCATRTGFHVEAIGNGEYAGFELDSDGRFLLGDFTVTHNTVVAAAIIRQALDKGQRVLFLAHRTELITQSRNKLETAGIFGVRVIQAAQDTGTQASKVAVASIPTLVRWGDRMPIADFVIFDECHHVVAKTWAKIAGHYTAAKLLGLTATPQRADGKALGDIFDSLIVGSTVRELTSHGHLVPCRTFAPPQALDARQLALDPVTAYRKHADGTRAVAFCMTVEHAERTAEQFTAAGVTATVVHGGLPRTVRDSRLRELADGAVQIVCSVHVLTEGWDSPTVATCILLRKPQHDGLFLQMVGRVLRPSPQTEKTHATLIDLCGSVLEHGTPDAERCYSLDGEGITRDAERDPIRQCPSCGGVVRAPAAGDACPLCGASWPVRPAPPVRIVNAPLQEITGPIRPRASWTTAMAAKFPGWCSLCSSGISVGQRILWAKGEKPRHESCALGDRVAAANALLTGAP